VEPQVANAFSTPAPDQTTFEPVLDAGSARQQGASSQKPLDPAATLVEIAEAQALLRSLSDASAAAKVIVERLERITSASAIAVAFLRNDQLEYCAAAGTLKSLAGSIVPIPTNIAELLQKDKTREPMPSDSRREHLQGSAPDPILFPFYDKLTMVGFLQLNFAQAQSMTAPEMQSCHVMANLMGEAVLRAAELQWKQALAKEHAAVLEALERLKPQLERLTADGSATSAQEVVTKPEPDALPASVGEQSLREISAEPLPDIADLLAQLTDEPAPMATAISAGPVALKDELKLVAASVPEVPESPLAAPSQADESAGASQLSSACQQCGFLFGEGESFCGRCGTPRSLEFSSSRSELAPAPLTLGGVDPEPSSKFLLEGEVAPAVPVPFPVLAHADGGVPDTPAVDGSAALALDSLPPAAETTETESKIRILLANEKPAGQSPWTSAATARTWLESLKENDSPGRRWLGRHQGDVSVVISLLVLLLAIGWWSPHQPAPKSRTKTSQPSLTLFERALVGLGLAEPPTVDPGFGGNPHAQVWEDVHTALYYCSGSEEYGKTDGGKMATQRDAQLDQFKPAALKACE